MLKSTLIQVDAEEALTWSLTKDTVMGGISYGEISINIDSGIIRFSGRLSLANDGGFVIARRPVGNLDLSGWTGFWLRLRGDGRVYRLSCETPDSAGRFAWQCSFPTRRGSWQEVFIDFNELLPIRRGKALQSVDDFSCKNIQSLGVQISDKTEGEFDLWIEKIGVYRS